MPFLTLSDNFFDFGSISSATPKEWKESIGFPDAELYTESFEKNSLKEIKYSRSSPDLGNSWCIHEHSYNFFLVFVNFRTLSDNSGKSKLVDSKQKN